MKELIRHIEKLLLTNNCVIIPNFGGFVAYYSSAKWIEDENSYSPPIRTIGFNAQLKMNDGLLVQSYMDTYGTDFPDANRLVEKAVMEMRHFLHLNGYLEMHGIGEMRQTIYNTYSFQPSEDGIMTPSLYAFSSFELHKIRVNNLKEIIENKEVSNGIQEVKKRLDTKEDKRGNEKSDENKTTFKYIMATVAIAAAVIILFFFMPTTLQNTDLSSKINLAEVIPSTLFQSTPPISDLTSKTQRTKVKTKKNKIALQDSTLLLDKYFIIVSNVGYKKDALSAVKLLKRLGHSKARVINGKRGYRICITSYSNMNEACKQLSRYRATDEYKEAWILINKSVR
jgi:hypothetical protein